MHLLLFLLLIFAARVKVFGNVDKNFGAGFLNCQYSVLFVSSLSSISFDPYLFFGEYKVLVCTQFESENLSSLTVAAEIAKVSTYFHFSNEKIFVIVISLFVIKTLDRNSDGSTKIYAQDYRS